MSAAVQEPAPTTVPDPHRLSADVPSRIGRVLSVVRRLIDYGKRLADTIQQRPAAPNFPVFARHFGTADVAAILARITAGLRRAAALEAMLCKRVERGKDLTPAPVRLPAAHKPRAPRQMAAPDAQPATTAEDPRLACLPTEQEIAAELRRRPIGAVVADICRDLGVMPGRLDRPFWEELSLAIITFGGSLSCFLPKLNPGLFAAGFGHYADPGWAASAPRSPVPATGPP